MDLEYSFSSHVQLLPGIPDDITLHQILPKLLWRDCHVLSSVSHSWRRAIQSHLVYGDKLVLTFERNGTPELAKTWIVEFNATSLHKLSYNDELIDHIFIVTVEGETPDVSKSALLSSSPLYALEVFASVNPFSPGFNPPNPVKGGNLKQLVAIAINVGGQFEFDALNYALKPVGRIIKFCLRPARPSIVSLCNYLGCPVQQCERCYAYDHEDCGELLQSETQRLLV